MYYMNEFEVEEQNDRAYMRSRFGEELPGICTAVATLQWLMHWTNHNSDGWAYWPKPVNAAKALIVLLEEYNGSRMGHTCPEEDIPSNELKKALQPIKAFLTRQGVHHSDRPLELR